MATRPAQLALTVCLVSQEWLARVFSHEGLVAAKGKFQELVDIAAKVQPDDDPTPQRVARQVIESAGHWC